MQRANSEMLTKNNNSNNNLLSREKPHPKSTITTEFAIVSNDDTEKD
jgi:hypothetical protein